MDATFWATVALVIFLGVALYFGVPGMISRSLDARADTIRNDLDEARRLREEAQTLLADYQKRREEAEVEAREIVEAARREADALALDAERKTNEDVARRTALAEQRIARAESEAIREVKSTAATIAVTAAGRILAEEGPAGDEFEASLDQVRSRLNG